MRNETARREREICAAGGVAFRQDGGEAYADKGDIPFKNFYGIVLQNRFTGSEILKKGGNEKVREKTENGKAGETSPVGNALLKVALGCQVAEVTEEYAEVDGKLKLLKRKKTKKDIPPDLKAVQILLEKRGGGDVTGMTDEELEREKKRLLSLLKAREEKEAKKEARLTALRHSTAAKKIARTDGGDKAEKNGNQDEGQEDGDVRTDGAGETDYGKKADGKNEDFKKADGDKAGQSATKKKIVCKANKK